MNILLKYITILIVQIGFINANCVLDMRTDLTTNHPLLLSPNYPKWLSLTDSPKGSVVLIRDELVRLACTNAANTNNFPKLKGQNVVTAKCVSGKNFEIDKATYSFNDLQCQFPNEPSVKKSGKECLGKDTELLTVGFKVANDFIPEYDVCFRKNEKATLYTEVTIPPTIEKTAVSPRESTWVSHRDDFFTNIEIDSIYTSASQEVVFKRILNKDYFNNNRCYLEKGKLVPNNNMLFAPEQAATSHYLNAVPQWSTCNRANWIEVEKRILDLTNKLKHPITVWSGTHRSMTIPAKWGFSYKNMYLHYISSSEKAVPVPLFIWKVVFDQETKKALAIIEINNPNLALTDVESLVLCEDRCKNVDWMNFLERKTISGGYVYCCDLNDFEFGFQFKKSPFPRASGILRS